MQSVNFLCSTPSNILVVIYFISVFVPFVYFGAFCTEKLIKNNLCDFKFSGLVCFGVLSVCGYIASWAFLLHMAIGNIFAITFFIYSLYLLYNKNTRALVKSFVLHKDFAYPILLIFFLGLYYFSISYSDTYEYVVGEKHSSPGVEIMPKAGAPDYLIQYKWMKYMVRGNSPWHHILDPGIGSTTVADRPPLMAGVASLYYTPSQIIKGFFKGDCRTNVDLYYFMGISTLLSLIWITAVWAFLRTIGFDYKRTLFSIICLAHIYFLFFSSVFTWPKSYAGSFIIGVFTLLIVKPIINNKPADKNTVMLASIFAGLAAFAHFSVVIPCVVIAALLLQPKLFPGIKNIILGSCIFIFLATPYLILTKYHEGSNKLTKYTMTTPDLKILPDEYQNLSTLNAVKLAYSKISKDEIIQNKVYNLKTIFSPPLIPYKFHTKNKVQTDHLILNIISSIGILNICWLLFLPFIFRIVFNKSKINKKHDLLIANNLEKISNISIFIGFASLFILAMINFRQPVMNINNIAPSLLLLLGLAIRIFSLPFWFYSSITVLNIIYFYDFIWHLHLRDGLQVSTIFLPVYLMSVIGLFWVLKSCYKLNTFIK